MQSEEDEEGGRRRKKKGIMQKIKDKLPGHSSDKDKATAAHSASTQETTKGSTTVEQQHENKGFMDRIKDKLPGHH